jgi:hypothetical protein
MGIGQLPLRRRAPLPIDRRLAKTTVSVTTRPAESSALGSGPVSYVRSIRVRDASGVDLTLYEFHDRRFLKKVRRMKLCTGEDVETVDGALVIVRTGERLTLVE